MYTEAKKPSKPGLLEELLVSLATAGLGSVISVLGSAIDRSVEKKLIDRLGVADPQWRTNPTLKAGIQAARNNVKVLAKGVNDGFKLGVEELVGPKVRELLASGKTSVDAFYEGEKSAVVKAGLEAFLKAKKKGPDLWKQRAVDPVRPTLKAQALLDAANSAFADAEALQMRATIRNWLLYTAQTELGTGVEWGGRGSTNGTDLSPLVHEGVYDKTPGVLFVEAYVADTGTAYVVLPEGGRMAGLSQPMLASLSGPIESLGLPIVYAVSSYEDLGGRGKAKDSPFSRVSEQAFFVGVNENGNTWMDLRNPRQKEALVKMGGLRMFLHQLGIFTLASLGVSADK